LAAQSRWASQRRIENGKQTKNHILMIWTEINLHGKIRTSFLRGLIVWNFPSLILIKWFWVFLFFLIKFLLDVDAFFGNQFAFVHFT
jgi:hypothetical protein